MRDMPGFAFGRTLILAAAATIVFAGVFAGMLAGGASMAQAASDHDRARAAVRSGQILPLNTILRRIQGQVPGRVLGARLRGDGRRQPWTYDIKVLTPRGDVVEIETDARSGNVLRMRGRSGGGRKGDRRNRRR